MFKATSAAIATVAAVAVGTLVTKIALDVRLHDAKYAFVPIRSWSYFTDTAFVHYRPTSGNPERFVPFATRTRYGFVEVITPFKDK